MPVELPSTAMATRYQLSLLPEDDESHMWDITVEYRGRGLWAVLHMSRCLSSAGKWVHEPIPSSRTKAWLAKHRFDLETALRLADGALPTVVVNGLTPAGYLEWKREHTDA